MAQTPAKTTNDTASAPSTSDLSLQVEALKADIAGLTETISALGKQKANETKEEIELRAQLLKERGKMAVDQAGNEFDRLSSEAERSIREKPMTALAIAAGVGLVVGFLTSRK